MSNYDYITPGMYIRSRANKGYNECYIEGTVMRLEEHYAGVQCFVVHCTYDTKCGNANMEGKLVRVPVCIGRSEWPDRIEVL